MDSDLQKKVDRALHLIEAASKKATEAGQPLEVCYSGGKDSDVILELTRMAGVPYRAIYKNTTIDPPGTVRHAREAGADIIMPKKNFRHCIMEKAAPTRFMRHCCRELKEYKLLDYAIIGVRRAESRARKNRYQEPEKCRVYSKTERVRQIFPILDFTDEDIEEFIEERGIRCHPLYYDEQGAFHVERRLGCMCCPMQSRAKRVAEFLRYPKMLRLYVKCHQIFYDTHPDYKSAKAFGGDAAKAMVYMLFCDNLRQFREVYDGENLFGEKVDCKAYLERKFNVKL